MTKESIGKAYMGVVLRFKRY